MGDNNMRIRGMRVRGMGVGSIGVGDIRATNIRGKRQDIRKFGFLVEPSKRNDSVTFMQF